MSVSLSPRDLALALGVSESSVRRWVDRGSIPSARTDGGHRRIRIADAVDYARTAGLRWSRPDMLGLDAAESLGSSAPEALLEALETGDESRAHGIVLGEFLGGADVAWICDQMIAPAMARIGELWHGGTEGILQEHRATSISLAIVHRLESLLPRPHGPTALGGALSGDPYLIPSAMASMVLRSQGLAAIDLGSNTPFPVLEDACRVHQPSLVWISISGVLDRSQLAEDLDRFLSDSCAEDCAVVLGGRGLHEMKLRAYPNVHRASSMAELSALGLGLRRPRAKRRKRSAK